LNILFLYIFHETK